MTAQYLIQSQMNRQTQGLTTKMQLILEKITKPSSTPPFGRPRLTTLLRNNLDSCSSTVISGRAGSGKTTLASEFARNCGRPVAWYKVDAPDGEISVFFDYLAASIGEQRPNFDEDSIRSRAALATADEIPLLSERLVFELIEGRDRPLLIVIEDLHLVGDTEWLVPFLERFLRLTPPEVHILITGRTLPPAPLWRMRSKQTLAVIDEATLAFTREEAVILFETYGLTRQQAYLAFDRTNGRAGALARYATLLGKTPAELAGPPSVLSWRRRSAQWNARD
jgi:LuxR family maltose regulon positive regulatory protein